MASYNSNYQSDFGFIYRSIRLNSRIVKGNGIVHQTTKEFDLPFLTEIFVLASNPQKSCCSLNFKPRAVKLYIDERDYLYLEHPFMPTSTEFLTFKEELINNSLILKIEYIGESLGDLYTNILTKNA